MAEYFATAPPDIVPEDFYALTKRDQADLIWDSLFVKRSPLSDACRGVLTVLSRLGATTGKSGRRRSGRGGTKEKEAAEEDEADWDLDSVRDWYRTRYPRDKEGIGAAERFSEDVYRTAGVRYAVMTNVPSTSPARRGSTRRAVLYRSE